MSTPEYSLEYLFTIEKSVPPLTHRGGVALKARVVLVFWELPSVCCVCCLFGHETISQLTSPLTIHFTINRVPI